MRAGSLPNKEGKEDIPGRKKKNYEIENRHDEVLILERYVVSVWRERRGDE